MTTPSNLVVVPVRYAAWLSGDLGRHIETTLRVATQRALRDQGVRTPSVEVTRLARGLRIAADEAPGPLLEAALRAVHDLQAGLSLAYPVFWHELGPLWTGTLQSVFPSLGVAA